MNLDLIYSGVFLACGTFILYNLKNIPIFIYSKIKQRLIYTVKVYQYDELFDMLEKWLAAHHQKQYKEVEACIGEGGRNPVSESDITRKVLEYKQEDNTFLFTYKGKRILITKSKEKLERPQSLREVFFRKYSISGIAAKVKINDLLQEVLKFSIENEKKNNIKVYTSTSYGEWYNGTTIRIKPIDRIVIDPNKRDCIINDVDRFIASEDWYSEVCIPYKRGYLFYGPPGTGKTTMALALANYTKRNVYCLNLNSIEDDSRLPYCFSTIPNNSLLLIEDIDKVFSGRENVKDGSKITFSSILNCLDGAFYKQGLIVVVTTNHIEKLDEALLRTGRLDVKMEIPKPTAIEIGKYLSLFYEKEILVNGEFDVNMSDVQEACLLNRNCSRNALNQIKNGNNESKILNIC